MTETKKSGIPWGVLVRILGVLLGLLLVFYLVDVQKLWQQVSKISFGIMLLALLINLVRQGLTALRWRLMNTESSEHTFWQYYLYTLVSAPAQLFVPGLVGVDLARGLLIGQSASGNRGQHLISVLSDRVIGLLSVIILGMGFAIFTPTFPSREKYIIFLGLLLVAFVMGLMISSFKGLHRLIINICGRLGTVGEKGIAFLELWTGILTFFRGNLMRVVWALLVCFLIHFGWFFIVYLLALNLNLNLSFSVVVTVTAISWVILAVPVSWMGLGVNELSFIFLLSFQGVPKEAATALSLHQWVINALFAVLCIPLLLFVTNKKKEPSVVLPEEPLLSSDAEASVEAKPQP